MSALKRNHRTDGLSELGHIRHSFHLSRSKLSESLPSIAGVSLGIQDVKSIPSVPVTKPPKSIPSAARMEQLPRKSVASKAVQVSSNEQITFQSKIEALERENLLLRSTLKEKEAMVAELKKTIENKTLQFSRDIDFEKINHKTTRESLARTQRLAEEKQQSLENSILHYETVNRELQSQYEDTIKVLREENQTEINIRDEKINKLKHQLSELFKDKSWEHQKQIEELQKEISRLSEEARTLHTKLKRDSFSKQECEKCKLLMAALEDSRSQLRLKNRTVEELQSLCQRFQNQLQQQNKLQNLSFTKTKM